jgi:DNA-binding FrmR family transcriptional regulator
LGRWPVPLTTRSCSAGFDDCVGQIEAIERGIEAGDACAKVRHLIAASRGAINALMTEVLEGRVREHLIDPEKERSTRFRGRWMK